MKQYRVTKYNPKYRKADGSYGRDEWTSYSEVGKSVSDEEYKKVEKCYIESALKFLKEQNISHLNIKYLENSKNIKEPGVQLETGNILNLEEIERVLKSILREKYWAKLENDDTFIHLGWDYYMYIGVPKESQSARIFSESKGLFVEEFCSPYN